MIDLDGYRPNVGIILTDGRGKLFWAKRIGQDAWQFPQGGIRRHESPLDAMYRELWEEVGLEPGDVTLLASTSRWLRYRLPRRLIRWDAAPLCIGQKQRWFLLRMDCPEEQVCFDRCAEPEFEDWRWVDYWQPLREVVFFKRDVYRRALTELAPGLFPDGEAPAPPAPPQRRRAGR